MFLFRLFCDTQEMHKVLIRESFEDYKNLKKNWNKKYPHLIGFLNIDVYNKLNEYHKEVWQEHHIRLITFKKNVINNILSYSANYPDEKFSKHIFIREHKKSPYILEQNIAEVLLDL